MNTDCKMYMNLINVRLAPWAMAKLHQDQKGFVPGWYITEHTRLASEVAHLSNATETNGLIVSLDQAKAYDCVDLLWLLSVLTAMGLSANLISQIADMTGRCRSRIHGITMLGLPPAKLMMYADDMNLFLSDEHDNVAAIKECLVNMSTTIRCKFNLDKTDVLPVGSLEHRVSMYRAGVDLPGACTLPPDSPLRILGVWIGSPDNATPWWAAILAHIQALIRQWMAIGTSTWNRTLIVKVLLLSRCYYLLDSNGIPLKYLQKINGTICRYVHGRFSTMAYTTLLAPLAEGGLNRPSLMQRKKAYNVKFLGDLMSGPQDVAWKAWTQANLH